MRTGQAAAADNAAEINDQIGSFLTPALLAFAGAALLVARVEEGVLRVAKYVCSGSELRQLANPLSAG